MCRAHCAFAKTTNNDDVNGIAFDYVLSVYDHKQQQQRRWLCVNFQIYQQKQRYIYSNVCVCVLLVCLNSTRPDLVWKFEMDLTEPRMSYIKWRRNIAQQNNSPVSCDANFFRVYRFNFSNSVRNPCQTERKTANGHAQSFALHSYRPNDKTTIASKREFSSKLQFCQHTFVVIRLELLSLIDSLSVSLLVISTETEISWWNSKPSKSSWEEQASLCIHWSRIFDAEIVLNFNLLTNCIMNEGYSSNLVCEIEQKRIK